MKVGDYVRTKTGLGKITEYKKHDSWGYIIKVEGTYNCYTHTGNGELSDIIKSSPNIIDLIEVGDYVNGIYIEGNKGRYLETLEYDIENSSLGHIEYLKIYPNDIKSIVTKEQFSSMEYKVGE